MVVFFFLIKFIALYQFNNYMVTKEEALVIVVPYTLSRVVNLNISYYIIDSKFNSLIGTRPSHQFQFTPATFYRLYLTELLLEYFPINQRYAQLDI